MVKKAFNVAGAYTAPRLREVYARVECGFAASGEFGADGYEDGNEEWLN